MSARKLQSIGLIYSISKNIFHKQPSLAERYWQSMIMGVLRVGDSVLVDDTNKLYIDDSIENGYITVWYLVSGASEEVGAEWYRKMILMEGIWYWYRNHHIITVAIPYKEASIIRISTSIQTIDFVADWFQTTLYTWLLVNTTKQIKTQFAVHVSPSILLHPALFQECSRLFFIYW